MRRITTFILIFIILTVGCKIIPQKVFSQNSEKISGLQQKIKDRNQEIEEIQKEIDRCEEEIDRALNESASLKTQITRLENTAAKLQAQIKLTERSISAASLMIEKLTFEIEEKGLKIEISKNSLAEIIRRIDEEESNSLLEILLAHASLSGFFDNLQGMKDLQKDINFNLEELRALKNDLENQQKDKETEKANLADLYDTLTDQKKIAEINKNQKNTLLTQTKNKESAYRKLLTEQVEKQGALEKEIAEFEEQLRMEIDPASLPPAGSGVLAWPIGDVYVTQYFGSTPFATQNPQVYNGMGHNGVDFRASVGTPIKAAKSGTVIGVGDTDKQCAGVSYGKWILIKHNNNLTTLYAHLSLIKVSEGQSVALGEVVGYSGATGYVTGPHLHFGVFAGQAVRVSTVKSKICGTNMILPVAPKNGYLNPLSYL